MQVEVSLHLSWPTHQAGMILEEEPEQIKRLEISGNCCTHRERVKTVEADCNSLWYTYIMGIVYNYLLIFYITNGGVTFF